MSIGLPAQQSTSSAGAGAAIFFILLGVAFVVLIIAAEWKVFVKAGKHGWAVLIPIYNTLVLLKIVGRPWWWLLLFLVPLVNFVLAIIVLVDLARAFGKGAGFAVGLLFLPFIFLPMLGFGDARYLGPPNLVGAYPPGPPGGMYPPPPPGGLYPPPPPA